MKKQAFALVKVVAYFRSYILNTLVKYYVPHLLVKMTLNQTLREGRWANWLAKLQEYDIEVRPLKVVKGQGLCKLIVGIDDVNLSPQAINVAQDYQNDWYKDLVAYLKSGKFPISMSSKEKIYLKMKENSYVLVSGVLFRRNYDGVLLRCFLVEKIHKILKEMHEGVCGGHFSPKVSTHCIIRVGYYWPTNFKDSYSFIRKCLEYQKFSR